MFIQAEPARSEPDEVDAAEAVAEEEKKEDNKEEA